MGGLIVGKKGGARKKNGEGEKKGLLSSFRETMTTRFSHCFVPPQVTSQRKRDFYGRPSKILEARLNGR